MGTTILENCGKHSDKLVEISKLIKEQKKINGEPLTMETILNIDNDIYEAYQTILSNLTDGVSIAMAINYLEKEVQNGGATKSVKNIASSVSQKVVIENRNKNFHEPKSIEEEIVAASIANQLIEKDGLKVLDNMFDKNTLTEMNKEIEKAKNGDKKAAGNMETYERAMAFLGKNPELKDEKTERGALGWMMNLASNESELNEKALIAMAKQYGFDILDKAENGEVSVNKEKLEKLYEEKIKVVNPNAAKRKISDFEKISEKRGEEALKIGKYEKEKTAEDQVKKIKKRVINSHEAYLEDLIESYNSMQEKGASQEDILKVQKKISVMSDFVKKSKEPKEVQTTHKANETKKESVDDELSL